MTRLRLNRVTPTNSISGQTGVFITVEGGDGVGKSTQINRLAEKLRARGREVVTTREPGGSPGAEEIRKLFVTGEADRWTPLTEALLVYAARDDHLERTIRPALARGAVVVSDRFADSTMAYQGLAGSLGPAVVETLHKLVVAETMPQLTLVLDAPPEKALSRADTSNDESRFEEKGGDFHRIVRDAFLKIAQDAPDRCAVIDATQSIETVEAAIWEVLSARLPDLAS